MKVIRAGTVEARPVAEEGARDATIRWLIARPEGAPNFAMRLVEVAPGGCTPYHQHAWEHEVFVLEGRGEMVVAAGPAELNVEDAVFVSPGEEHQIRNTGEGALRVLCLIPLSD